MKLHDKIKLIFHKQAWAELRRLSCNNVLFHHFLYTPLVVAAKHVLCGTKHPCYDVLPPLSTEWIYVYSCRHPHLHRGAHVYIYPYIYIHPGAICESNKMGPIYIIRLSLP